MKVFTLLSVLLLVGCQSVAVKNISRKSDEDVLNNESMLRFDENKLSQISQSSSHSMKSVAFCYQGKIEQGLALLKNSYKEKKNNSSYWTHIGTCYLLNNQMSKARLFFQKSAQMSQGQYAPALNNLGLIYLREKQYEASLISFKKAIKVNQRSLTPQFNLGHLYLKLGNANEAEKIFERLYRLNQKDVDVISALGSISFTKGQMRKSLEYYQKIKGKDLERPDIAFNYIMVLTQLNLRKEAKAILANVENHKDWSRYKTSIEQILD